MRPLDQLPHPRDALIVFLHRLAVLVFPVRRHAFLGDAVHFLRADLHFEGLATVKNGGVQGLVQIGPGHGDVILKSPRDRPPDMMHHAEGRVTIPFGIGDDANGQEIVDLLETALLAHNFAVQRIQAFDARFELRGNAVFNELGTDGALYFLEEFFVERSLVQNFLLQSHKRFRLEISERQVLQLTADDAHAQPMSNGRINVESFAGDALLLLRFQIFQRPHVVQTVGELDQHDANIIDHGQKHLADVFGLARLGSHHVQPANFGDAFHQPRNFNTEALLDA